MTISALMNSCTTINGSGINRAPLNRGLRLYFFVNSWMMVLYLVYRPGHFEYRNIALETPSSRDSKWRPAT